MPKCVKCGAIVQGENELDGLCVDCAETELLTELWSEGEAEGQEFEELAGAANTEALQRVSEKTLQEVVPDNRTVIVAAEKQNATPLVRAQAQAGTRSWFRRMLRAMDVSSEFVAKALIAGAGIVERIFSWVDSLLGEIMLVALLICFVILLVWLVKWLWVHLPV